MAVNSESEGATEKDDKDGVAPRPTKLPDKLEALPKPSAFPRVRHRWNTNEEIAGFLLCFDIHQQWLSTTPKLRPQSGSMILYNRKKVKYRKDGYSWKKRKDGKTTREDHMKLKVQGVECLYGCYVHSSIVPTFHRRCYWLLQNPDIVLVHYLNVPTTEDSKPSVPPTIPLRIDSQEWTKDELLKQLKPMFAGVKVGSNNDVSETIEAVVEKLLDNKAPKPQPKTVTHACVCAKDGAGTKQKCGHTPHRIISPKVESTRSEMDSPAGMGGDTTPDLPAQPAPTVVNMIGKVPNGLAARNGAVVNLNGLGGPSGVHNGMFSSGIAVTGISTSGSIVSANLLCGVPVLPGYTTAAEDQMPTSVVTPLPTGMVSMVPQSSHNVAISTADGGSAMVFHHATVTQPNTVPMVLNGIAASAQGWSVKVENELPPVSAAAAANTHSPGMNHAINTRFLASQNSFDLPPSSMLTIYESNALAGQALVGHALPGQTLAEAAPVSRYSLNLDTIHGEGHAMTAPSTPSRAPRSFTGGGFSRKMALDAKGFVKRSKSLDEQVLQTSNHGNHHATPNGFVLEGAGVAQGGDRQLLFAQDMTSAIGGDAVGGLNSGSFGEGLNQGHPYPPPDYKTAVAMNAGTRDTMGSPTVVSSAGDGQLTSPLSETNEFGCRDILLSGNSVIPTGLTQANGHLSPPQNLTLNLSTLSSNQALDNLDLNTPTSDVDLSNFDAFDNIMLDTQLSDLLPELENTDSSDHGNDPTENGTYGRGERSARRSELVGITDFSPEWSYPEGGVKILVTGPWHSSTTAYSCVFDDISVPASLVQSGVLRCYCPAHETGLVTLQVAASGVPISKSVVFEYRTRSVLQSPGTQREWLSLDERQFKISILERLEQLENRLGTRRGAGQQDSSGQGSGQGTQHSLEDRLITVCSQLMTRTWIKPEAALPTCSARGMTLLHLAAALGYRRLAEKLMVWRSQSSSVVLEVEVDPLNVDHFNCTPLMWACAMGHTDTAYFLCQWNRAALTVPDSLGRLPASVARARGHPRIAEELELTQQEGHLHSFKTPSAHTSPFSPRGLSLPLGAGLRLSPLDPDHSPSSACSTLSSASPNSSNLSPNQDAARKSASRLSQEELHLLLQRSISQINPNVLNSSGNVLNPGTNVLNSSTNVLSSSSNFFNASTNLLDPSLVKMETEEAMHTDQPSLSESLRSRHLRHAQTTEAMQLSEEGYERDLDSAELPPSPQHDSILLLAERIVSALPPRFMDDPEMSDEDYSFLDHTYRDVRTPGSVDSPVDLDSPDDFLEDFAIDPHDPPPTREEWCEFLNASGRVTEELQSFTLTDQEQKKLYRAAAVIQNAFRQYKSRRQRRLREIEAAILIQNYYRRYAMFKKMNRAAILIQSRFRRYYEQKRFRQLYRAAVLIQSYFRSFREHERFRQYRRAAIIIQKRFRGHCQRKRRLQEIMQQYRQSVLWDYRSVFLTAGAELPGWLDYAPY
ncbi:calmodulin-binding transcription activator 2-like isoform X1 [Branchiostoma lanceolatum]|uniref:calmodulin-binding transcription activator 2-like isoform X1 n=1 Tax=Branchiostoma lanceolatum TaxID=7740 RepID=UPI0034520C9A